MPEQSWHFATNPFLLDDRLQRSIVYVWLGSWNRLDWGNTDTRGQEGRRWACCLNSAEVWLRSCSELYRGINRETAWSNESAAYVAWDCVWRRGFKEAIWERSPGKVQSSDGPQRCARQQGWTVDLGLWKDFVPVEGKRTDNSHFEEVGGSLTE